MYSKVETNLNFVEREKQTEKFWKDHDIFRKSMENRKEGETYTFYDGPPHGQWKAPYRACIDARHQGHDPQIPDDEREDGPT